jgi:sugar-phosphatase
VSATPPPRSRASIDAVIFDMDGLLIDSEPHWRDAEREVFARVGLALTDAQCRETTGLRIDEVVGYWYARARWREPTPAEVGREIVASLIARLRRSGVAKPGVPEALRFVRSRGVRVGLASSSSHAIIAAVLEAAPTACLAIEDSLNGVLAAKSARMRCLAVPEHEALADPRFSIADAVVPSLLALTPQLWVRLGGRPDAMA